MRYYSHEGEVDLLLRLASEAIQKSLVKHFEDIKDPRVERTKKHQLRDILVIAMGASQFLKWLKPTIIH
ncbi:transposase family protein [Nostoc sp. UIC 10890]